MKRLVFFIVLWQLFFAQAIAKELPEKILQSLPEKIENFIAMRDASSYDDTRLGASRGYNDADSGIVVTIYLYDLGARGIEEGIGSEIVNEAREGTMKELEHLEGIGYYKNVKIISEGKMKLPLKQNESLELLTAVYSFVSVGDLKEPITVHSELFLVGMKGYICKVRVTRSPEITEEKEKELKRVIGVLLSLIKS